MSILEVFLSVRKLLVTAFNEMCTLTFRKYIVEQEMNILKFSEKLLW